MEIADVLIVALAENLEEVTICKLEELHEERRLEYDVGLVGRVFVGVNVSKKREQMSQELEALG